MSPAPAPADNGPSPTDLAIDLVWRGEEELIASLDPKYYLKPHSYQPLAMTIFYEDWFNKGEDPEAKLASNESLKLSAFDNFVNLPVARMRVKCQKFVARETNAAYPQPIIPFRFSYTSRPELLELPETKRMEAEDLLLSQISMDSTPINDLHPNLKSSLKREPLAEDAFSLGSQSLRQEGEFSVWIVFASRTVLDVNHIMDNSIGQGWHELKNRASATENILDFHGIGDELMPGGGGECWHLKDAGLPQSFYDSLLDKRSASSKFQRNTFS